MTPLETRKAELREYIEARAKATEGEWRWSKLHQNRSLQIVGPMDEFICELNYHEKYNDNNTDLILKAANESARIAEQLLECIEALEYYANGVNWYTMKENQDSISTDDCSYIIIGEDEDGVVTSKCGGKTARKLLNKIAGEK